MDLWVEPSLGSTIAFVTIVMALALALVLGVHRSALLAGARALPARKQALKAMLFTDIVLIVSAVVSFSGVLEYQMFPPPAALFFLGTLAVGIGLAFSRMGKQMAFHLPLYALVGFQVFRLPLELVLHAWYEQGVLPVQMTYSGDNFDIVTGILAIVVAVGLSMGRLDKKAVWVFNVVGSLLLLRVASIALLSAPLPIRSYMNDPPVLLAFHAPYSWIGPICVAAALFGHIAVFRALLKKA